MIVAADDANAKHLALLDLEGHVLQRPEFLNFITGNDLSSLGNVNRSARKVAGFANNEVAKSVSGAKTADLCPAR